jgi:hypothetical protein
MRKSNAFFLAAALQLAVLGLLMVHAAIAVQAPSNGLSRMRSLVGQLELTDLCLFTEARYTRHLSQADLHTPFQDHPLSLEHFPSGSFLAPPATIEKLNERLD